MGRHAHGPSAGGADQEGEADHADQEGETSPAAQDDSVPSRGSRKLIAALVAVVVVLLGVMVVLLTRDDGAGSGGDPSLVVEIVREGQLYTNRGDPKGTAVLCSEWQAGSQAWETYVSGMFGVWADLEGVTPDLVRAGLDQAMIKACV